MDSTDSFGPAKPVPHWGTVHIATRTIQLREGWVGQIVVDDEIVWESDPTVTANGAATFARERALTQLARLFGED